MFSSTQGSWVSLFGLLLILGIFQGYVEPVLSFGSFWVYSRLSGVFSVLLWGVEDDLLGPASHGPSSRCPPAGYHHRRLAVPSRREVKSLLFTLLFGTVDLAYANLCLVRGKLRPVVTCQGRDLTCVLSYRHLSQLYLLATI